MRKGENRQQTNDRAMQLTMFELKDDELRQELRKLNIEAMTPLEAIKALADLKEKMDAKD